MSFRGQLAATRDVRRSTRAKHLVKHNQTLFQLAQKMRSALQPLIEAILSRLPGGCRVQAATICGAGLDVIGGLRRLAQHRHVTETHGP